MIKAIFFDLDGTLVNSLADLANSGNYALQQFGFPTHKTDDYKYFVGDGMHKLIERILPLEKRTETTVDEVLAVFMNHYRKHFVDKTAVYNGIIELLSLLKKDNYKTVVISNKEQGMATAVTEKLLGGYFDLIYGKREDFPAKPNPKLLLKIMGELNVRPEECIMIGDSGMDMAVAVNAECKSIGVLWGFRKREELAENGADYIVKTPEEIYNIIKIKA